MATEGCCFDKWVLLQKVEMKYETTEGVLQVDTLEILQPMASREANLFRLRSFLVSQNSRFSGCTLPQTLLARTWNSGLDPMTPRKILPSQFQECSRFLLWRTNCTLAKSTWMGEVVSTTPKRGPALEPGGLCQLLLMIHSCLGSGLDASVCTQCIENCYIVLIVVASSTANKKNSKIAHMLCWPNFRANVILK